MTMKHDHEITTITQKISNFISCFCFVCTVLASRVKGMFCNEPDHLMKCEPLPQSMWQARPDPSTTGIRYLLSSHGMSVRTSWPLPPTSEKIVDEELGSCDGCRKVRTTFVGHRQRSGFWFVMCMHHQRIVGFHLMVHGEGRRDTYVPLLRFMENPPKVIFGDYVCGVEETCFNYVPEFFKDTQFFHDIFHGCCHVCSERFCSRRLSAFASLNTSLMEQVRSLQCSRLKLLHQYS